MRSIPDEIYAVFINAEPFTGCEALNTYYPTAEEAEAWAAKIRDVVPRIETTVVRFVRADALS